jgi:hypothetical protein
MIGIFIIAVLKRAIFLMLVALMTWLIVMTAVMRFARADSIDEAFNFGAVFTHNGKIGWMTYSIALLMIIIALVKM